ncbi:unnamed protein product [Somion occarium]|uniref:Uncharacterized protein n=1 Tax=Somion occarium TaxID=3059160 RepID=A0ABP1CL48_9APHY
MAATRDGQTPPPSASVSSFSRSQTHSVRSASRALPSGIRTVVTAPPWARDEPPSPYDQDGPAPGSKEHLSNHARPSADVASFRSSTPDDPTAGPSRWWAFTRHRPDISLTNPLYPRRSPDEEMTLRGSHSRDRSKSIGWLASSISRRSQDDSTLNGRTESGGSPRLARLASSFGHHLNLPSPEPVMTMSHNQTPGWDSPWSPRAPADLVARITGNGNGNGSAEYGDTERDNGNHEKGGIWARRKKKFRVYILTNVYVPLLFRFVNITFTIAALVMAVRIRAVEKRHSVLGAVGASPTLVIIFAPLTLTHVMIAVYLEYFGRPLGLWRTSGKLAHTLIEVIFICAWSAALALSFDNFFTSVIPCASSSSTAWYNEIQRPPPPPNLSSDVGKTICSQQLALICLVGVGLIMYCYNLVISLFRIFEKVKYHPVSLPVR